jgi:DhnA family fructose-bisphosphate aldolase class Ia
MGDTITKYHEIMSDREIMNAKRGVSAKLGVQVFEKEYPELSKEFKKIQKEQYELFARKMMDYGLNNVTLGGDIVNNNDDKKFSLTGLTIRLTDKINRLRNLVVSGKQYVKDEGMEDTFIDIANYGVIGMLVGRNKWKK